MLSAGDQLCHPLLLSSQLLQQDLRLNQLALLLLHLYLQVHLIALTFMLLSLQTTYESRLLRELRLQVCDTFLHAIDLIVQLLKLRIFCLDLFLGLTGSFFG